MNSNMVNIVYLDNKIVGLYSDEILDNKLEELSEYYDVHKTEFIIEKYQQVNYNQSLTGEGGEY